MNKKQIVELYYKSIWETPATNIETARDVEICINAIKESFNIVLTKEHYYTLVNTGMLFELSPECDWSYDHDKDIIERNILLAKIKKNVNTKW